MRVGIVHFMAFPQTIKGEGPVVETVSRLLNDNYFDVVEVTSIKDDSARSNVAEMAKKAGKTIGFSAIPPLVIGKLNLSSPDAQERLKAVAEVKNCIKEAFSLGAKIVALNSGKFIGEPVKQSQITALLGSLDEICRYASGFGVTVVMEPFDRSIGKNCLIGPTHEAVEVASVIRKQNKNFGLMLDLSHLPLLDEKPADAVKLAKDFLLHVHVGNCVMRDKTHPAFGDEHPLMGIKDGENGVPEISEFWNALLETGYLAKGKSNIVSLEVKPFGSQTSEEVIEASKHMLEEAWALV
jgi:sugar phosphate isomerase/epimerase